MVVSLKKIECFVFDMDGTIYLGDTPIEGALDLIQELQKRGTEFFFFTNNSSKSPESYVKKLQRLGFKGIERKNIMTSGDVMIHYLKQRYPHAPKIYLVGTPDLQAQFSAAGIELLPADSKTADAVVVAFDTTLTFEKVTAACRLIAHGVPFLATNIDKICPIENGEFLPDCGSICRMIENATGVMAKFTGKPYMETVQYILDVAHSAPEKTAIVGDRMYTDLATAAAGGIVGIAVLSGEISLEDIKESHICPDYILHSVADILAALEK